MPVSYYPVPDGYIVWRDDKGYHVAKQPKLVILSASNRTLALQKLYTYLQVQATKQNESAESEES